MSPTPWNPHVTGTRSYWFAQWFRRVVTVCWPASPSGPTGALLGLFGKRAAAPLLRLVGAPFEGVEYSAQKLLSRQREYLLGVGRKLQVLPKQPTQGWRPDGGTDRKNNLAPDGKKTRKSKPSQWGSGDKANMGASSVHLSRPRRSFGDVPIPGKVTRPPGRNPQRKSREEGRQGEPRPTG